MISTVTIFGIRLSQLGMHAATSQIIDWCGQPRSGSCRYVVTPNVDHAVLLRDHAALQEAYRDADLVLADGKPIVWAANMIKGGIPERVAGSDLVPQLLGAAHGPLRVFLMGGEAGVADEAARRIVKDWPCAQVVGTYSPPYAIEFDAAENETILKRIRGAAPDLLIVGLGAPKQELWVHQNREQIHAKVALCVGATIDFLAGHRKRSPVWMRNAGLEWLHRVACEPRRLARRYARDAWVFPKLIWNELRGHYS